MKLTRATALVLAALLAATAGWGLVKPPEGEILPDFDVRRTTKDITLATEGPTLELGKKGWRCWHRLTSFIGHYRMSIGLWIGICRVSKAFWSVMRSVGIRGLRNAPAGGLFTRAVMRTRGVSL